MLKAKSIIMACVLSMTASAAFALSCPSPCTGDYAWANGRVSGDSDLHVRCDTSTGKCQYSCQEGDYGRDLAGNGSCNACPGAESVADGTIFPDFANWGDSDLGLNADITGCYIPVGMGFSDGAGAGVLISKCYYKK